MPPFNQVQTLYATSLQSVFRLLRRAMKKSGSVEVWRPLIQSSLHAGIKEHLVQIATLYFRTDAQCVMDLLSVLLDKAIKKLDHTLVEPYLRLEHCAALYSTIECCNAVGLHELTMKVALDPPRANHLEAVSAVNGSLHRVLRAGLAASLRKLVLRSVADDETLRLLGRYSPHLQYLDVTSSWLVDDDGLKQLCFKDSIYGDSYDVYDGEAADEKALNPCCHTLQEIRIQDTNTSELGVALLLLLIPDLKSLGGFIYYRNVGDAIVNMRAAHPKRILNLTQLWDTSLPPDKAELMAPCTPFLSSLYTRGSFLGSLVYFPKILSITVDFDFADYSPLLEIYLSTNGAQIKELIIVDQNHPLDLSILIDLCPKLELLDTKLFQSTADISVSKCLPHLTVARIRIGSTLPLITLLGHVHSLERLEIALEEEYYGEGVDFFEDSVILEALEIPGTRALTSFLMLSECEFSARSITVMMLTCPMLQRLGDLKLWNGVKDCDLQHITCETIHSNYCFSFRYGSKWYPPENLVTTALGLH